MISKNDKNNCREIRKLIVEEIFKCREQNGHLGGCLSCVEILYTIYSYSSNIKEHHFSDPLRDRIILSKAHAGIALFSTMAQLGLISKEELLNSDIRGPSTLFTRQPQINKKIGIEITTGSLGLALSYACGLCLSFKSLGSNQMVFVVLGDGECQEGSVWESLMFAASKKLDDLIIIIDRNKLQLDGPTNKIVDLSFMDKALSDMGFYSATVDGHDVEQLKSVLTKHTGKPTAVIANTIKGKGISFAENNYLWHDNFLSSELKEQALKEIDHE